MCLAPTIKYPVTVAVSDVHGAGTRVHIPAHGGPKAHNGPPDSILSYLICVSYYPEHPLVEHISPAYLQMGAQQDLYPSIDFPGLDDGSNGDGTSGGDEYADGVVHLARRSSAEGGDNEISGDSGGVGMMNLSTSALVALCTLRWRYKLLSRYTTAKLAKSKCSSTSSSSPHHITHPAVSPDEFARSSSSPSSPRPWDSHKTSSSHHPHTPLIHSLDLIKNYLVTSSTVKQQEVMAGSSAETHAHLNGIY
ncbi:hypothetical protein Tco_0834784 [Tanacetum coccineum]